MLTVGRIHAMVSAMDEPILMDVNDVWQFLNDNAMLPPYGSRRRDEILTKLFSSAYRAARKRDGKVADDELPF